MNPGRLFGVFVMAALSMGFPACKGDSAEERLAPLPDAPRIAVDPEALPGADGSLAVVIARPTGTIAGAVRPTVTFSKPVAALEAAEAGAALPATIEPEVAGKWKWLGSASAEFVADHPFPYATQFRITVPAGIVAIDGSRLENAHSWEFETPRPKLQRPDPGPGFAWLAPIPRIELLYNQALKDLDKKARFLVVGKGPIGVRVVEEKALADEIREEEPARRYERAEPGLLGFRNRQTRYTIEPVAELPLDAAVTLEIDASLQAREGPLTGEGEQLQYRTYGSMRFLAARACDVWGDDTECPRGPILLLTSNVVEVASLKTRIRIEPPVELDWEEVESSLPPGWGLVDRPFVRLAGAYKAGTTYRVVVDAGVLDVFGQPAPAFEATVHTADLRPQFELGSNLALLEAGSDGALPLETVNLNEVEARFWELSPSEMARLLDERWCRNGPCRPDGEPIRRTVDVSGPRNVPRKVPLSLRGPMGIRTGLFHVEVEAPELSNEYGRSPETVTGQITDLAVHAKLGSTSGIAWVTSLASGRPVERAEVSLYDKSGTRRWKGETDGDGIAQVPGLATLLGDGPYRWGPPFALLAAEKDGDVGVTLSSWQGDLYAGAFGLPSDWDGTSPVSLGTVFAERGIYRPGDEVYIKGLSRFRLLGELAAPPAGTEVSVEIHGSTGDVVFSRVVPMTAFGTFSTSMTIDAGAPLGHYSIHAKAKSAGGELHLGGEFRVEEYRAPQFRVDVTAPSESLLAGEPLAATVLARYLHGGAMADAPVRWTATREMLFFEPSGNPGFSFGPQTWFWDDETPRSSIEVVAGGEARTDAAGVAAIAVGRAETVGDRTYGYTVEAEVADVNRQRMANRARVIVHPASFYAGVKVGLDGFATAGKPVGIEVIAVDPAGLRQSGKAVSVEVRRREWRSIRKQSGNDWITTSEPVETRVGGCDLRTEPMAVSCTVTPEEPGLYVVEATGADGSDRKAVTRTSFYVVGSGWVSWQRTDTSRLDLVADRLRYDLGDTAKILVKSPYPEAEALVTVEREGVRSARRVKLAGAASTVEVPIEEWMIPNAFVSVVTVRGRVPEGQGRAGGAAAEGSAGGAVAPGGDGDPGKPEVRVGYVELSVEKRSKRLAVTVTPDAAEKRPGERLAIDVKVADARGKGRRAEVTLWAVDEGVLRLTGYELPDPVELIHQRRGLSVRIGEPLIFLVERQRYGDKGRSPGGSGGGDASGAGFRSRFQTTVLFSPELVTDASGHARAELTLPDNLTTYRIMAVAVTQGEEVGTGSSEVTVTQPLLVLPALPRSARIGDRFEAGVVVHAKGLAGDGRVTLAAEGIAVEGPTEKAVPLAAGPQEVRFRFRADREGTARLRFAVTGAGERDGVEATFPVKLPVAMEAVATYGDTKDQRVEAVVPPGGVHPGIGGLEITLASTALVGLDEGMRQLVEYPYGCLEQLSSRLVPFVALRELSGRFGVAWEAPAGRELFRSLVGEESLAKFDTTDPDAVVKATVAQIQALQEHDGGFRYWSSDGCSAPYASAYAVLALGRAKEVGYPVDAGVLARGQEYLANTVAAGKRTVCRRATDVPDDATRVWALWALARTGAPKSSYYGELAERRDKLPLFARALLADSMFIGGGDRPLARKVLAEVMNHAQESAGGVHFQEVDARTHAALWSSDARTTAIVLLVLADVSPDHPFVAKLARWLVGTRRPGGDFGNTQEAAFALMAMSEVVRTKERETPDFTARVALGDRVLVERAFEGRSLQAVKTTVPIEKLGGGKQQLAFTKEGDGVLYYGALLRYAPAEVPMTPLDRGIVVQRWFEPFAGGGQTRTFAAGEVIRVRLRVGSPRERQFVAVEVPLPAGLEAVDTTLASSAAMPATPQQEEGAEEGYEYESAEDTFDPDSGESLPDWALGFWSPFHHVERRDDRVVLFANRLPPGIHVVSFVARATTMGDFLLPPANAHEMYAPETFGRSDGGRLQVTAAQRVTER